MTRRNVSENVIRNAMDDVRLLAGEPELVVVDARVLRLLMGDLASLIILRRLGAPRRPIAADPEQYVWDEPC